MTYAMLRGNPSDGFEVIGPFEDSDMALAYMESETGSNTSWIVEMIQPDPWFVTEYKKEIA